MNKHPNLLSAANSLIVIVDFQGKLSAVMPDADKVRSHITILLEAAQRLFVPVVVTEQYPQGLGHTEAAISEHFPEQTPIFEKSGFSCYAADGFSDALHSTGRKQIVLLGQEAHVCVLQTAMELLFDGYQVQIVEDAVCSRTHEHKLGALERLRQQGATITNYESVLFEWLRDAAHPEFKSISRLLR
jgi:nicotinamidase-related amidase